ncbi:YlbF family regulator [Amphibacillus sp. MSJ-3]|uniref:YlbF family regulator n=1 Tax=Amphibacillus sp. MSJ-3 TaxID=2841505 RepID=UPI001C0F250C|nr:YlbF family regulator [Amphibacillus sp. MSJ-3]MBU5595371.1 YlbF family regulator [Amphibacillus sp. MSJ-3]
MSVILENANALEQALRDSEEFKGLKAAYDAVMNDEIAKKIFDDFRTTQIDLQQKQMQGLEITEEEVEKARKVVETVQQHEQISNLMAEEQRVNDLINEVSRTITKPLEELYSN